MLSRLALAVGASTPKSALLTSLSLQRLLHTTNSTSSTEKVPGEGTGAAGSEGAAPGRAGGDDSEVKFGDSDACKRVTTRLSALLHLTSRQQLSLHQH
jgi:hypothetical protein